MKKLLSYILPAVLMLFSMVCSAQFTIPDKPLRQTSVYDYARLMNKSEAQYLENKLLNYADSTSTQIVVITVDTLNGNTARFIAPSWAEKWGIGQRDKDNGVLILVSKKDRDMYIATGYGVQGRLTAGITGEIVREKILPEFKDGDYYAGLDGGTNAVFNALSGRYKEGRKPNWWQRQHDAVKGLIVLAVIVLGLSGIIYGLACLVVFLFGAPKNIITYGTKGASFKLPAIKRGAATVRSGFKGGFGGGRFSGGGAGGSW